MERSASETPPGTSRAGRLGRALALSALIVFGITIGVGVAELFARVYVAWPPKATAFRQPDPILHHRLRPNAARRIRGVEFRTNAIGFHDRDYPERKPAASFRIVMLGDSFTEGGGLRLDDTVAKRAERLLNQSCGRYEVLNLGAASYSPLLEYLVLKTVGLRFEPDLVIVNFDISDVRDDFIRTATARFDANGRPVAAPLRPRAERALVLPPLRLPPSLAPLDTVLRHSALYQVIRTSGTGRRVFGPLRLTAEDLEERRLIGDPRYDPLAITREQEYPHVQAAWAVTERYIVAIRDLARSSGAGFVVVVYPWAHQVSASAPSAGLRSFGVRAGSLGSDRPFTLLEALGRRADFPVINLLDRFRARAAGGGPPLFWDDDVHHTPEGAKVFAEGIVEELATRGIVAPC